MWLVIPLTVITSIFIDNLFEQGGRAILSMTIGSFVFYVSYELKALNDKIDTMRHCGGFDVEEFELRHTKLEKKVEKLSKMLKKRVHNEAPVE